MVTNLFAGVGLPTLQQGACHIFIPLIIKGLKESRRRQEAANSGKAATVFLAAGGEAASLPPFSAVAARWFFARGGTAGVPAGNVGPADGSRATPAPGRNAVP